MAARPVSLIPLFLLGSGVLFSCSDKDDGDDDTGNPGEEDVDSDGDGLLDKDEEALGTDPDNVDSDGDGLGDGEEVNDYGTDPLSTDSDGDGYEDGWEVTEGTDPADESSVIYTGGWPYNPDKDDMSDPGWGDTAESGAQMPRFAWLDQYGEEVDIYDFAYQGKPIVIDLSGVWCYWCHEMAKWHVGQSNAYLDYGYDTSTDWYNLIPTLVDEGDIYWVTVLDSNSQGGKPDHDDVLGWFEDYPNPHIPVLLDEDQDLTGWINPAGYPTVLLLEEDMTVGTFRRQDYTKVFDELVNRYGE